MFFYVRTWRSITTALLALCLAGCSDDGGKASGEVVFHGQLGFLPSFSYDTGYQPAASPIQVRLELNANGNLKGDAKGKASGEMLEGTAGTGAYSVEGKIVIKPSLKLSLPGMNYEGPIPNAPNIELAFNGNTVFDPFLIGQKTTVTAKVPATKLATIPLAGALSAVPGIKGDLTIMAGGDLSSDFSGVCAAAKSGAAQYTASTSTSGNLEITPVVEIQLPLAGSKKLDGLKVTVPIPAIVAAMDLGTVGVGGGAPPAELSPCSGSSVDAGSSDGVRSLDGSQLDRRGPDGRRPDGGPKAREGGGQEGGGCALGTPDNCPSCGVSCPGVDNSGTQRVCRDGATCDIDCLGDYYDVNGSTGDGCEMLDALGQHSTEATASLVAQLGDCDPSKTFSASIPSDARSHVQSPNSRTLGTPKWFKLHINDGWCVVQAKMTLDFSALPSGASYKVSSKYVCDSGTKIAAISTTLTGGQKGLVLDQDTSCSALSLNDSGTLYIWVEKVSGATVHSNAKFSITIEP